jgi:hypothetical protein
MHPCLQLSHNIKIKTPSIMCLMQQQDSGDLYSALSWNFWLLAVRFMPMTYLRACSQLPVTADTAFASHWCVRLVSTPAPFSSAGDDFQASLILWREVLMLLSNFVTIQQQLHGCSVWSQSAKRNLAPNPPNTASNDWIYQTSLSFSSLYSVLFMARCKIGGNAPIFLSLTHHIICVVT